MDRQVASGQSRPPGRPQRVLGSRASRPAPVTRHRAWRPVSRTGPGPGLRRAAGYALRLLLVGAAAYALFLLLERLQLVAVALFVALVFTAVLRPLVDLVARMMPRPLAVLVSLVAAIVAVVGLLVGVGEVVAAESAALGREVRGGLDRIERWLQGPPFHVDAGALSNLQGKLGSYVSGHRGWLVSTAVSSAGRVVEAVTGLALALFCSVFFLHSGERMWDWAQRQLGPRTGATWDRVGRTAWGRSPATPGACWRPAATPSWWESRCSPYGCHSHCR